MIPPRGIVSRLSLIPQGWIFLTFLVFFKGDSNWEGQKSQMSQCWQNPHSAPRFHPGFLLISFRSSRAQNLWGNVMKTAPLTAENYSAHPVPGEFFFFPGNKGRIKRELRYLRVVWFKVCKSQKNLGFVPKNHLSQR